MHYRSDLLSKKILQSALYLFKTIKQKTKEDKYNYISTLVIILSLRDN